MDMSHGVAPFWSKGKREIPLEIGNLWVLDQVFESLTIFKSRETHLDSFLLNRLSWIEQVQNEAKIRHIRLIELLHVQQ